VRLPLSHWETCGMILAISVDNVTKEPVILSAWGRQLLLASNEKLSTPYLQAMSVWIIISPFMLSFLKNKATIWTQKPGLPRSC
jgi:hypothetical protein